MDERLASILQLVGGEESAAVAAGALGVQKVLDPGQVAFEEIDKPHADARTIGIVRVAGTASVPGGAARPWSSVLKVVDLAVEGFNNSATSPQNEERVYERGVFAGTRLKFRPARCFHISRPAESVKVLWLEDLTNAKGAPFEIGEPRCELLPALPTMPSPPRPIEDRDRSIPGESEGGNSGGNRGPMGIQAAHSQSTFAVGSDGDRSARYTGAHDWSLTHL